MAWVEVYGERFEVPRVLVDEMVRLRAFERQLGDEERERVLAAVEEEHGPLPRGAAPWVLVAPIADPGVGEHRAEPRPEAGGQA